MKQLLGIIIISFIWAQSSNIEELIDAVLIGNPEPAEEAISTLVKEYPNNPSVMYLQGLVEMDGELAKNHFKSIFDKHPNSDYSDDAVMKVAEYYYATGYYIQSAEWLKKMPLYYPRSVHIERAVKLFLNSLVVSGSKDTAVFYSKVFKKRFPNMDIDGKIAVILDKYESNSSINNDKDDSGFVETKVYLNSGLYSLQIGAFSKEENANSRKIILVNSGFNPRVDIVESNGNVLYAVREGFYSERDSAKKIAKQIKARLGMDTIVVINK